MTHEERQIDLAASAFRLTWHELVARRVPPDTALAALRLVLGQLDDLAPVPAAAEETTAERLASALRDAEGER